MKTSEIGLSDNLSPSLNIREITAKSEWEDFLNKENPATFLQSWNWGEFNKSLGHKIWRLGLFNNNYLIGGALIIKIIARRGTFLFCPHGPLMRRENLRKLIDYLKDLAKKENCGFIRISPLMIKTPGNEKVFRDLNFRKAPMNMHAAELVWMLGVIPNEDELLRNMRKTTRYLIRKVEAHDGVEMIKGNSPEHLEFFKKLYGETAKRQHFVPYSDDFLNKEFEAFKNDNQIEIFLAKYNNEYVSGAMIIFYGDSAFYHQGASSLKYPKISAPYLFQGEIIREVKNRGLRYYNFWGIAPEDKPNHPWAGLSLFKKGFGGFSAEYLPAQDLPLKKSYWITYLIEKARKVKRRL